MTPVETIKMNDKFIGLYKAPDGRRAVVTEPSGNKGAVVAAAEAWVQEAEDEYNSGDQTPHFWVKHPELLGLFRPFRGTVWPMPVPLKRP